MARITKFIRISDCSSSFDQGEHVHVVDDNGVLRATTSDSAPGSIGMGTVVGWSCSVTGGPIDTVVVVMDEQHVEGRPS